jgi:hypothetical protein
MKISRQTIWAFITLVAVLVLAYSNTFTAPFIFDDYDNIVGNSSIRQLWPPWHSFNASAETGLVNRPVISFSLAVNYAISGYNVWSYHVLNLVIHILATLIFLKVVRLTLISTEKGVKYFNNALLFSFACALLWGLHPLHTQAVTYIIQRCESLMGLFFLLALYGALRGWQAESSNRWHLMAIMFFFLAVYSKEVAIVYPIILLLYEWTFRGNKPLQAIRQSPLLYTGLTIVFIIAIITTMVGNTIITRTDRISFTLLNYWLTQCEVIFHYLRLAVWPSDLTIDYDWPVTTMREVWPFIIGVLILMGLSAWALWHRNAAGFLGAWFFLILSPTSLIPLPDPVFEHRMYLPLAAIIVLILGATYTACEWVQKRQNLWQSMKPILTLKVSMTLIISIGLIVGFLTHQRNSCYRSELFIWLDTIEKRPNNMRGYHNVGVSLRKIGQFDEALKYFRHSLLLNPNVPYTNFQIGFIFLLTNKPSDAIPFFLEALRIKPDFLDAHNGLGVALAQTDHFKEAIFHFSEVLRIKPDDISAQGNLIKATATYEKAMLDHRKN